MRRFLRILSSMIVLSALVIVGIQVLNYTSATSVAPEDLSEIIDETTVEVGDLSVTVNATGALAPAQQVPLVFELTAPIVEILVKTGDYVEAGDELAKLDATDFEVNLTDVQLALEAQQIAFDALTAPPREVDLKVAEASLTAAQSSYYAAVATGPDANQVEIARLQAELARNQFWQTQLSADPLIPLDDIVFPPEVPPDLQQFIIDTINGINAQNRAQFEGSLESQEYGVQIADANYASTQSQGPDLGSVNSANAGVIQAQITLDQLNNGAPASEIETAQIDLDTAQLAVDQAQQALNKTILTAPISGVIAANNLVVGQLPPTEDVAMLLMDTSSYYIELPIDETDIVSIQPGQPVTLVLDALPDVELTGKVTRVAVTPTVVGQLVTYLVRVELDPTDAPIRVGMSATARITTQALSQVLIVRNRFIRIDRATGQAFVTVKSAEGQFAEIPVVLGLRNETFSQVVSGVETGQILVLLPRGTVIPGVTR
ncbi:MAG: HlyD family efflux transporter periplasmic adaptor subunit [Anaerolineae bacterium]|nr:HlyD family efflux transporter periplasmic adaptor subunit [Anaerolineae bacterium]